MGGGGRNREKIIDHPERSAHLHLIQLCRSCKKCVSGCRLPARSIISVNKKKRTHAVGQILVVYHFLPLGPFIIVRRWKVGRFHAESPRWDLRSNHRPFVEKILKNNFITLSSCLATQFSNELNLIAIKSSEDLEKWKREMKR